MIPESFGDRVVGIDADMKQSIEDIFRWARLMPLPNQKRGKFVPGPEAVGTTRLDKASVKAGAEGKKLMGSGFAKGGKS